MKKIAIVAIILLTIALSACSSNAQNRRNLKGMLDGPIPDRTELMNDDYIYEKFSNDIKNMRENIKAKKDVFNSYMILSAAYMNFGEKEKALAGYDYATQIGPTSTAAWLNKGNILEELGRYEEAEECYSYVISQLGVNQQSYFSQGKLMRTHLKRSDEEIRKFYDKALTETGYGTLIVEEYIKYLVLEAEDKEAAEKVLDEALKMYPENVLFNTIKKENFENL